jgi:predicted alpha-1,6-mannanase (GH76 family)
MHRIRPGIRRTLCALVVAAFALCATKLLSESAGYKRQVQAAVDRLQQWYEPSDGLWQTTGWWNSANDLTAVIDFSRATNSGRYNSILNKSFAQHKYPGFLNDYYDDEGWWALAWIDAYDLTRNAAYLQVASTIFTDMTGGWDDTCGGGIWWSKERNYKNAIANELFLDVAAHLANRHSDTALKAKYLTWAEREWQWFQNSSMIAPDHQINDGLTPTCRNNHKTVWSYNQGVILGGLAELSKQPHQSSLVDQARQIADAAILHLTDQNGVLHDPCEPKCSADSTQFKGIFVRNLAILQKRKSTRRYTAFFRSNADSMLKNAENSDHSFGTVWSGPPESADASTQSSAIDALNALLIIHSAFHFF